ncbi:MAG: rod shape-determining protein MreD [Rhodoferax sp.]
MIMPRGQPLLLPVNPAFMVATLVLALALVMLQGMIMSASALWLPDWLALVLLFWTVHQPLRVGMLTAFGLGLVLDVHQGALLGQNALAYSVLSYLGTAVHRRLLWFGVPSQALQVVPIFAVCSAVSAGVRLLSGADFPGWPLVLAPVLQAALWPAVSVLLLAPQRRPPDPDQDRPL